MDNIINYINENKKIIKEYIKNHAISQEFDLIDNYQEDYDEEFLKYYTELGYC